MFPQRLEIGHHHLFDKVTTPREVVGFAKGHVTRCSLRINLWRRPHTSRRLHVSHCRSKRILLDPQPCLGNNPRSFHIEPVARPVLLPLILLCEGNLQTTILLSPLRHEGATGKLILNFHAINLHLLRLTLKFIIRTKCIQVRGSVICLTGIAKFAQHQNTIGHEMMELYLEGLQNQPKEVD